MVRLFGEGVKTSEISDVERVTVAKEMESVAKRSGAPETDEPAEPDASDF